MFSNPAHPVIRRILIQTTTSQSPTLGDIYGVRSGCYGTYNHDQVHLSITLEQAMADANFADKTIWTGDNLDILRGTWIWSCSPWPRGRAT